MQHTVFLPAEVSARVKEQAQLDGLALTNTVARLLAEALEVTVPTYCQPKNQQQQELPLKEAS